MLIFSQFKRNKHFPSADINDDVIVTQYAPRKTKRVNPVMIQSDWIFTAVVYDAE